MIDRATLEAAVREVVKEVLREDSAPRTGPRLIPRRQRGQVPFDPEELTEVKAASPARLAQGRAGLRYLTPVAVNLRAEHAVAVDAVHSVVPEDFPSSLGALSLRSRATDHEDYLLYPDHGRRLSDDSRALLEKQGTRGADIQLICGDGLSAWAILENGPALVPALLSGLKAAGFSVGVPLFVHHARIGVADEIGVLLGARATVILVGERPGLGTGDSLSIYTAYGPKLNQDNAEKDCISNVRPLGIPPVEAAAECVDLLTRTFAAGGGGVHLTRSGG